MWHRISLPLVAVKLTQLEKILHQLHHLKPEACDNAEFYQVILREEIPVDNLQPELVTTDSSTRREKNKITIFTLHGNYEIHKLQR